MGSAQTTISLGVNGAIRLTTARYCRPSGHLIDEGIEPDVVVEEEIPDRLSAGKAADELRAEADLRKQDIDDDSAEMGGDRLFGLRGRHAGDRRAIAICAWASEWQTDTAGSW